MNQNTGKPTDGGMLPDEHEEAIDDDVEQKQKRKKPAKKIKRVRAKRRNV